MRISRTRLLNLKKRIRAQKVLDAKSIELGKRMEAADARIQQRYRERLSQEELETYESSRDAYYEAYSQKWIELRSSMPHSTLAEKFKIADRASAWARGVTGFLN
ncbi:MAG: hypothetical protein AB2563_03555 [Candidatus Thiodiazotropha endolucinida]